MPQIYKPKQRFTEAKEGGGSTGKLIGAIVGGAAGAMTLDPMAAIGGAGGGANLGEWIGEKIDPSEKARALNKGESLSLPVSNSNSAIQRRAELNNQAQAAEAQARQNLQQLADAANTLPSMSPEIQQEYGKPIYKALAYEYQRQNRGGGV